MSLTSEERSAINRQNAANSTGPKSSEGKAASRRNALKHGLRADAIALPNEDPSIVAARNDSWNDYYKPQSPAAQHLVNQCVQATLLADRCHQFHHAALSKQIREFELNNDATTTTRPARMATQGFAQNPGLHLVSPHPDRPRPALFDRALGKSRPGPRLGRPLDLRRVRRSDPPPGPPRIKDTLASYPDAWLTRLYRLICTPRVSKYEMAALFEGIRFPSQYQGVSLDPDHLPDLAASLASLHGTVDEKLTTLRDLEEEYRELYEDPHAPESESRAMILRDASTARLFLRYHAESRTAFHRAYRELVKTLEADAASPVEDVSPNEPDVPEASPPPAQAAVSPNEPNSDVSSGEYKPFTLFERLLKELPSPTGTIPATDEPALPISATCPESLAVA